MKGYLDDEQYDKVSKAIDDMNARIQSASQAITEVRGKIKKSIASKDGNTQELDREIQKLYQSIDIDEIKQLRNEIEKTLNRWTPKLKKQLDDAKKVYEEKQDLRPAVDAYNAEVRAICKEQEKELQVLRGTMSDISVPEGYRDAIENQFDELEQCRITYEITELDDLSKAIDNFKQAVSAGKDVEGSAENLAAAQKGLASLDNRKIRQSDAWLKSDVNTFKSEAQSAGPEICKILQGAIDESSLTKAQLAGSRFEQIKKDFSGTGEDFAKKFGSRFRSRCRHVEHGLKDRREEVKEDKELSSQEKEACLQAIDKGLSDVQKMRERFTFDSHIASCYDAVKTAVAELDKAIQEDKDLETIFDCKKELTRAVIEFQESISSSVSGVFDSMEALYDKAIRAPLQDIAPSVDDQIEKIAPHYFDDAQ